MVHIPETPFAPAAPRPRRDGWTPPVQAAFVAALGCGASVREACAHVGRSRASAYALRQRADASAFAAAWDDAVGLSRDAPVAGSVEAPIAATVIPVFHRGRRVGERTAYDNRAVMLVLRADEWTASQRRAVKSRVRFDPRMPS